VNSNVRLKMMKTLVLIATVLGGLAAIYFFGEKAILWLKKRFSHRTKSVETTSKYHQSIPQIVQNELSQKNINIENIIFEDELTINDLELFCRNVYAPRVGHSQIHDYIKDARATAYTIKYADPKEDEKTIDIKEIKLPDLKQWHVYLSDLLLDRKIDDLNALDILDVGIGNGHAYQNFFKNIRFSAVDISDKALDYAKKIFANGVNFYNNAAEELHNIKTRTIDLYLSLRTFQSTLLDKRMALHEAYRVLKPGGIVLISIPIMFVKSNGEVLQGLIPPGSEEPTMEYAEIVVKRIEHLMKTLNFKDVRVDKRSPFEIFLLAER